MTDTTPAERRRKFLLDMKKCFSGMSMSLPPERIDKCMEESIKLVNQYNNRSIVDTALILTGCTLSVLTILNEMGEKLENESGRKANPSS